MLLSAVFRHPHSSALQSSSLPADGAAMGHSTRRQRKMHRVRTVEVGESAAVALERLVGLGVEGGGALGEATVSNLVHPKET